MNSYGSSIDYSRWEVADREFSPNNELQYYRPEQVTVSGGQLHITATDLPLASKPYRSGLIRTWQEHRYGRWEVRADLPWGKGMWPAIWLLPRYADWPVGGEIDIMENIGSNTYLREGLLSLQLDPGFAHHEQPGLQSQGRTSPRACTTTPWSGTLTRYDSTWTTTCTTRWTIRSSLPKSR